METWENTTVENSQASSPVSPSPAGGEKARYNPAAMGIADRYISRCRRPRRVFSLSEMDPIRGSAAASMIRARAMAVDALNAFRPRT